MDARAPLISRLSEGRLTLERYMILWELLSFETRESSVFRTRNSFPNLTISHRFSLLYLNHHCLARTVMPMSLGSLGVLTINPELPA